MLGLLLVAAVYAGVRFSAFLHSPVTVDDGGSDFVIEAGSSFHTVSETLASNGIITHPRLFRAYARWQGVAGSIHAGDYLIQPGTTPAQLLEQFTSGDVRLYSFTIVEGWNRWELLHALQQHEFVDASLSDEDWGIFCKLTAMKTRASV